MTGGPVLRLHLLRHPEVAAEGRAYGRRWDPPWSPRGEAQAREVVTALAGAPVRWRRLVSSPAGRALRLAEAVGSRLALPVEADERLEERDLGAWERRPLTELPPEAWADRVEGRPPGGESFRDLLDRVAGWWASLPERRAGGRVLVVAHGGTIRALLVLALGMAPEAAVRVVPPHASRTDLAWTPEGGVLTRLGAPAAAGLDR